jgi:hypothetical protein
LVHWQEMMGKRESVGMRWAKGWPEPDGQVHHYHHPVFTHRSRWLLEIDGAMSELSAVLITEYCRGRASLRPGVKALVGA